MTLKLDAPSRLQLVIQECEQVLSNLGAVHRLRS